MHDGEIYFIETKATVFGGQKALLARCLELDRRGLDYTVIHPFPDSIFLSQYRQIGLSGAVIAPEKPLGKLSQILFILRHLRAASQSGGVRAVHCDAFDSAYLAAALRRAGCFGKARLIFTIRSERYLRFNAADRFLIETFDQLCTNSDYSREKICAALGIGPDRVAVTASPIDFSGLPRRDPKDRPSGGAPLTIGFAGSFDARKRLDRFVDFGLALLARRPERAFRFRVYGSAKTKEQITVGARVREMIATGGASEAFAFEGYAPAGEIAEGIDVLFCPFDNEPLGRVVPEFLYMGVPVIAHDDGGLREAGAGAARMISGADEAALRGDFLAAVDELLSALPTAAPEAEALRRRLETRFGSAAVVDKELALYRLPADPARATPLQDGADAL